MENKYKPLTGQEDLMYVENQLTLFDLGEVDYKKLADPFNEKIRLMLLNVQRKLEKDYLYFWLFSYELYDKRFNRDISDNYDDTIVSLYVQKMTDSIYDIDDDNYEKLFEFLEQMVFDELVTKKVYEAELYDYFN